VFVKASSRGSASSVLPETPSAAAKKLVHATEPGSSARPRASSCNASGTLPRYVWSSPHRHRASPSSFASSEGSACCNPGKAQTGRQARSQSARTGDGDARQGSVHSGAGKTDGMHMLPTWPSAGGAGGCGSRAESASTACNASVRAADCRPGCFASSRAASIASCSHKTDHTRLLKRSALASQRVGSTTAQEAKCVQQPHTGLHRA
jgi:hypothetical protein